MEDVTIRFPNNNESRLYSLLRNPILDATTVDATIKVPFLMQINTTIIGTKLIAMDTIIKTRTSLTSLKILFTIRILSIIIKFLYQFSRVLMMVMVMFTVPAEWDKI